MGPKSAAVGNPKPVLPARTIPDSQYRILIGLIDRPLSVVCQENLTRYINNYQSLKYRSSAKRRAPHNISPPYSCTAFASPPFLSRPWISIPIDRRSE
jgi:hypothetical protein